MTARKSTKKRVVPQNRRKLDEVILNTLQNFKDETDEWRNQHSAKMQLLSTDVETIKREVFEQQLNQKAAVDKIVAAFPDADFSEHNRFHEIIAKQAMQDEELKQSVKGKLLSGGIWALVVLIGYSLWEYIKSHVR